MKKISIWIGGLLIALLVVGGVGTAVAYAQAPEGAPLHGPGPGKHRLSEAALEAAAKALNMTTDEVKAALQSGKNLRDLAEDAGVDFEKVHEAIEKVRETEIRERIAQAVKDGKITKENADWLLEGLAKGFLNGPGGFGFGQGPKGPGGGQPPFGPQNQNGGG